MKRILHIVTRPMDPAVEQLILNQRQCPGQEVLVHRLDQRLDGGDPEYRRLLEEVFQADSIECW